MDLVVDANIIFSILISESKTEEIIYKDELSLFAPEFLFDEFGKYEDLILSKTKRTKEEFDRLTAVLQKKIKVIPNEETKEYIEEAKIICPDKNDADYFALALKMKCAIWSNDKALKNQGKIIVYSTHELLWLF